MGDGLFQRPARAIQQYTIDLFNNKKISILICTSTIIEGVNTVAKNVIIYDNRNGIYGIDRFTHNNIKGRAGRMRVHFIGNVFCLEPAPEADIESRVVEIPLGLQDEKSPLNLLAGAEREHINEYSLQRLDDYVKSVNIPKEIFRKFATFKVYTLDECYKYISSLNKRDIQCLSFNWIPEKRAMEIISEAVIILTPQTLRSCGLQQEVNSISGKLYKYINSNTYQEYLTDAIKWLHENYDDHKSISDGINRELKTIRNLYSFALPKVLSAVQDLVNFEFKNRQLRLKADYSGLISKFENYHLPSVFSAIEEMGIPIQTIQKLVNEKLATYELSALVQYLKMNYSSLNNLSRLEKKFIKRALL